MIHRYLNICKAGTSPQSPDAEYYYSGSTYKTRDEAIKDRRWLSNVVATVEIEFEEEMIRVDDPDEVNVMMSDVVKATCPHCKSGDIPKQRPDTREWTHFNEVSGVLNKPVSIKHTLCLASHLRNSKFGKLING